MTFAYPTDSNKAHPLPLSPEYKSSILRAPQKPLIPMRHTLSELTGPGLRPRDRARGRCRSHHPAQGRAARRAHHRARPCARRGRPRRAEHAGRGLAGQCLRPLHPCPRPASGAARSEFHRRRPRAVGRLRLLQIRHHQARRLSLGQSPQCLAAGAHPLLGVRPFLRLAAGDADVFPGRSAVRIRPDLQFGAGRRKRAFGWCRRSTWKTPSRNGRCATASTSCCAAGTPRPWRKVKCKETISTRVSRRRRPSARSSNTA